VLFAAALILQSVTVPGTQLHVKLASQVGQPYDERAVEQDVRYLWNLGRFDDVRVEEPEPGNLVFRVRLKPRLVLRDIRLTPHSFGIDLKLPPGTPIDRPTARAIARDIERKLDARVEEKLTPRGQGKADLELHVITEKKPRPEPSDEIRYEVGKGMCRTLFLERRDAQRAGVLDFAAHFTFHQGITFTRGPERRVGRIEFRGNRRFPDALLRRHMLLDEGAIFDERLLRLSISRINRSGLFEPIDERHVLIDPDGNITVRLTERRAAAWNLAGPWPLEGSVRGRIPKFATYAASVSVFGSSFKLLNLPRRFFPVFSIQRPYLPGQGWRSGFSIAPQLGWRGVGVGYAAGQIQQRLIPLISGERSAEPPIPITGDIGAACVTKPRLKLLRTGATAALSFLGTLM